MIERVRRGRYGMRWVTLCNALIGFGFCLLISSCGSAHSASMALPSGSGGYLESTPSYLGWVQIHYVVGHPSDVEGSAFNALGPCLTENREIRSTNYSIWGTVQGADLRLTYKEIGGTSPNTINYATVSAHSIAIRTSSAPVILTKSTEIQYRNDLSASISRWRPQVGDPHLAC